jgi:glycosyltransferase involved in cell wall biosynthesis
MKIAWFTPFSNKSAIGKYSQIITNQLIKHCDVDLWIPDSEDLLCSDLKMIKISSKGDTALKLRNYDFIIYNMGNYLFYHMDIYEVSRVFKGVVVLHDFVMHHFFAGYYLEHKKDNTGYLNAMTKYYGQAGKEMAINSINGKCTQVWETAEVVNYPFFEKAIEGATGVIVHSNFHASKIRQGFIGPVGNIYHPFNPALVSRSRTSKADLGLPADKLLMITIGHVNPNKRIDKVIEVLAENKDLAAQVIYVVIGSGVNEQYFSYLKSIVKEKNLQNTVRFTGFQPDHILGDYMLNADIFINLRFPAMESSSWSLVEQLHYGKPVIVIDNGFYSEIPDGCLIKIKVTNEIIGLQEALTKLAADQEMRARIGEKGKQFAIEHFTAEKYCNSLLSFLPQVQSYQPVLKLVDRVGQELSSMGTTDTMDVVSKVAQVVSAMFGQR